MRTVSALLLSLSLGLACATTGPNKGELNLISPAQEAQIGEQVDAEVRQQFDVRSSAEWTRYLQALAKRIAVATPLEGSDFRVHLIMDPAINAMAIPGGDIYVNSGLVLAAENEAELAGVMAHEMGHVVERHGTEQLSRALGFQAVAGLALGENPGLLAQLVAQVGGTATLLRFGRDAEREADELAVAYLYHAGLDPRGIVQFFELLAAQEPASPRFLAWLQSHPLTEDRIADARRMISRLEPKPVRSDSEEFHAFKRKVRGAVSDRSAPPAVADLPADASR